MTDTPWTARSRPLTNKYLLACFFDGTLTEVLFADQDGFALVIKADPAYEGETQWTQASRL